MVDDEIFCLKQINNIMDKVKVWKMIWFLHKTHNHSVWINESDSSTSWILSTVYVSLLKHNNKKSAWRRLRKMTQNYDDASKLVRKLINCSIGATTTVSEREPMSPVRAAYHINKSEWKFIRMNNQRIRVYTERSVRLLGSKTNWVNWCLRSSEIKMNKQQFFFQSLQACFFSSCFI